MSPQSSSKSSSSSSSFNVSLEALCALMKKRSDSLVLSLKNDFKGISGLCEQLKVNPRTGLIQEDSENLKARRLVFGVNELELAKSKTFCELIREALLETTIIMLEICASLSIGLAIYKIVESNATVDIVESGLVEGVAILFCVAVIILVGSINNYQKEQQFQELQKRIKREIKINVLRDGVVKEISTFQLLVGDICIVKYGDVIPADGLLLECEDLQIDESSLTGESDLIVKNAESNIGLLSGTNVMQGNGKMLVTAVGMNSQAGEIIALMNNKKKTSDGEAAGDLGFPSKTKSVLKAKLEDVANKIGIFGALAAMITVIILITKYSITVFYVQEQDYPWTHHLKEYFEFALIGVTILVVAIPEGLPLAVTISLAYSVNRMAKHNNLVRHLDACETIGNATTICSDKTGTLTTNKMTVDQCFVEGELYKDLTNDSDLQKTFSDITPNSMGIDLYENILFNTAPTSRVEIEKNNQVQQYGIKTECALLAFLYRAHPNGHKHCVDARNEFAQSRRLESVYPFNSSRKLMRTIIKLPNNQGYRVLVKGASEVIIEKCSFIHGKNSDVFRLDSVAREDIQARIVAQMGKEGLRTICLAYVDHVYRGEQHEDYLRTTGAQQRRAQACKIIENNQIVQWSDEHTYQDMVCVAVFGIEDPLRPGVARSISMCQNAGITVRMVTGDSRYTAEAIATKCGIIESKKKERSIEDNSRPRSDLEPLGDRNKEHHGDSSGERKAVDPYEHLRIMESEDFNRAIRNQSGAIDQKLFDGVFPHLRVLARSTPEDKYNLVKHIIESKAHSNDEVVAVTGDGTNDAPALKKADVGFAMGICGTEVAKEASDIIITNDNFNSLLTAVVWGRHVYDSIVKFIQFQLTVNLVAVAVSVVSALLIGNTPLRATQMLWLNLLMDTLGSMALSTENPTPKMLLLRKPHGRTKSVISASTLYYIVCNSIYQIALIFSLVFNGEKFFTISNGRAFAVADKPSVHFTIVFNTLVMLTLFNMINSRKLNGDCYILEGFFSNPVFVLIFFGCFSLQFCIVQWMHVMFHCKPLNCAQWFWCISIGSSMLLWHQLITWFRCPVLNFFCSQKKSEQKF